MPVDGTYGRLAAHNRRLSDLKYKKSERKKNINSAILYARNSKESFDEFDRDTVEKVRSEIKLKALIRKRKERNLWIVLSIVGFALTVFFTYFIINL
ncbi:MAG: hypothetical protein Aureis2KO_18000 [Aureisphaera sp.]